MNLYLKNERPLTMYDHIMSEYTVEPGSKWVVIDEFIDNIVLKNIHDEIRKISLPRMQLLENFESIFDADYYEIQKAKQKQEESK